MNCKPGDLAICIRPGPYLGTLYEVLYVAPMTSFLLPNGAKHIAASGPNSWVVRCLCRVKAPFDRVGRVKRTVQFGVAADAGLRPLRPGEEGELEDDAPSLPAPVRELEAA